jgi:hypothetical protein
MTDEKKKPEEDEVTDEQLEEVAGGVNLNTGDAIQESTDTEQKKTFGQKLGTFAKDT